MGGHKLLTYTLQSESGESLRGAGWKQIAAVTGNTSKWDKNDGRKRTQQAIYGVPKYRWEKVGINIRTASHPEGVVSTGV